MITSSALSDNCKMDTGQALSCRLTTPELRKRKETVIQQLKNQLLAKKELPNGYAYQFEATDSMIDELAAFIKTERTCCGFFNFSLSIKSATRKAWLKITGPKGTKEFIETELEL